MLINEKTLKRVRVETQSGQFLGLVFEIELETDTGVIEKYHVKGKKIISLLFENELIINRSQIISLDDKKMVVEDGVVKALVKEKKVLSQIETSTPVITSKEF